MSRKRKPNRVERKIRQEKQAQSELEDVIQDTAGRFTCSTEIAGDFAWQCGHACEDLGTDILFNRLAHEIWREQPGRSAQELATVLFDLLAERERYRTALTELETRFARIDELDAHEHLEPIEIYRARVGQWIKADLAAQAAEPLDKEGRLSYSDEI